ncbi:MAG: hypothetical protein ISS83_00075 [Candidatus Pacebacteria bacterium]|nr:hypothetical protein [Candidatus Paceibacterota bacterium]
MYNANMQVFEFHFNPKKQNKTGTGKDDFIFDSFCFEPSNVYEKRMGSLYLAGLLKNVLPQNLKFLDNLAKKIKEKYYKAVSGSQEKSLKDTLKTANEHLEKIAKAGDVSWLGNLSFAVVSLKDYDLNFTKVGDFKTFLLRKNNIVDIDQKIRFDDIEPYPLKIFGNIVSGKLAENDIIVILSKEMADAFLKENLLSKIAAIFPFSQRKLKEALNEKKEQLTKTSGLCLLIALTKQTSSKEKEMMAGKKSFKMFSLVKEVSVLFSRFASIGNSAKEVFNRRAFIRKSEGKEEIYLFAPLLKLVKKAKLPKPSFRIKIPFRKPQIKIAKLKLSLPKIKVPNFSKKIILILALIAFLALGFFIFQNEEENDIQEYQKQLNQIQEKIHQAESYLIIADFNPQAKENANNIYKEIWDELSSLENISLNLPKTVASQVQVLRNTVSEDLSKLNNFVQIPKPEEVFKFEAKTFIPQKMISFNNEIYCFSSLSKNILKINQENKDEILQINEKIKSATLLSDSILFFSKPNKLINLKNSQFSEAIFLKEPSNDFDFNALSSFRSSLYFLETKSNSIIRYPFSQDLSWGNPEAWISPETKTAVEFKSIAVDGSVWILTKENTIERYYNGKLQETINIQTFPFVKNLSKIFTSNQLQYLYILEPEQKRIIILNKSGQTIRQYQSDKFDNLLDFSISQDGKTIWLLNGLTLYKLNL